MNDANAVATTTTSTSNTLNFPLIGSGKNSAGAVAFVKLKANKEFSFNITGNIRVEMLGQHSTLKSYSFTHNSTNQDVLLENDYNYELTFLSIAVQRVNNISGTVTVDNTAIEKIYGIDSLQASIDLNTTGLKVTNDQRKIGEVYSYGGSSWGVIPFTLWVVKNREMYTTAKYSPVNQNQNVHSGTQYMKKFAFPSKLRHRFRNGNPGTYVNNKVCNHTANYNTGTRSYSIMYFSENITGGDIDYTFYYFIQYFYFSNDNDVDMLLGMLNEVTVDQLKDFNWTLKASNSKFSYIIKTEQIFTSMYAKNPITDQVNTLRTTSQISGTGSNSRTLDGFNIKMIGRYRVERGTSQKHIIDVLPGEPVSANTLFHCELPSSPNKNIGGVYFCWFQGRDQFNNGTMKLPKITVSPAVSLIPFRTLNRQHFNRTINRTFIFKATLSGAVSEYTFYAGFSNEEIGKVVMETGNSPTCSGTDVLAVNGTCQANCDGNTYSDEGICYDYCPDAKLNYDGNNRCTDQCAKFEPFQQGPCLSGGDCSNTVNKNVFQIVDEYCVKKCRSDFYYNETDDCCDDLPKKCSTFILEDSTCSSDCNGSIMLEQGKSETDPFSSPRKCTDSCLFESVDNSTRYCNLDCYLLSSSSSATEIAKCAGFCTGTQFYSVESASCVDSCAAGSYTKGTGKMCDPNYKLCQHLKYVPNTIPDCPDTTPTFTLKTVTAASGDMLENTLYYENCDNIYKLFDTNLADYTCSETCDSAGSFVEFEEASQKYCTNYLFINYNNLTPLSTCTDANYDRNGVTGTAFTLKNCLIGCPENKKYNTKYVCSDDCASIENYQYDFVPTGEPNLYKCSDTCASPLLKERNKASVNICSQTCTGTKVSFEKDNEMYCLDKTKLVDYTEMWYIEENFCGSYKQFKSEVNFCQLECDDAYWKWTGGERECVSTCADPLFFSSGPECLTSCDPPKFISDNGGLKFCYDTCPNYFLGNECKNECTFYQLDSMECIENCTKFVRKVDSKDFCIEQCNFDEYAEGIICLPLSELVCIAPQIKGPSGCEGCSAGEFYYEGNCLKDCPAYMQPNGQGMCAPCVDSEVWFETLCTDTCPNGYEKRSCPDCATKNVCYSCQKEGKVFYQDTCVSSCPEFYLVQEGMCLKCPNLFSDGSCVDSCSEGYIEDEINKVCVNCTSGYLQNNECLPVCNGFVVEEGFFRICVDCGADFFFEGTCVEKCPLNTFPDFNDKICRKYPTNCTSDKGMCPGKCIERYKGGVECVCDTGKAGLLCHALSDGITLLAENYILSLLPDTAWTLQDQAIVRDFKSYRKKIAERTKMTEMFNLLLEKGLNNSNYMTFEIADSLILEAE